MSAISREPVQRMGGNVQHCCKAFGLSELALRTAIKLGLVRSVVCGRKTVITYHEIRRWLATLPAPKAPCRDRINNNNTHGESHEHITS
jgi:hypothetical protein